MKKIIIILFLLGLNEVILIKISKLKRLLLKKYDADLAPQGQVNVTFGLEPICLYYNKEKSLIEGTVSLRSSWVDDRLNWTLINGTKLDQIILPRKLIWTPDITSYKTVTYPIPSTTQNIVLYKKGLVYSAYNAKIEATCPRMENKFNCSISYISWTSHMEQIDLMIEEPTKKKFDENCPLKITDFKLERVEKEYSCCPEKFVNVLANIILQTNEEV